MRLIVQWCAAPIGDAISGAHLVDKCLGPELAKLARRRRHGESSHVVWAGKSGWRDWSPKTVILDGDWTFVTKNSVDFRGPANEPGSKGQHADVAIHAGLICLNGPEGMDLDLLLELFEIALDEVGRRYQRCVTGIEHGAFDDPLKLVEANEISDDHRKTIDMSPSSGLQPVGGNHGRTSSQISL